jgi:hypothetical protein
MIKQDNTNKKTMKTIWRRRGHATQETDASYLMQLSREMKC